MKKGSIHKNTLMRASKLGFTVPELKLAQEQYNSQRKAAKRRNIAWEFKFEEWVKWWQEKLGPDWQKLRGRGKDKFCMSRKGDKGPYNKNNVECILHPENIKAQLYNGTRADDNLRGSKGILHHNASITEESAKEIFSAKGLLREIAERFNVSIGIVNSIKRGRTWNHVTGAIVDPHHKNKGSTKLDQLTVIEIFKSKEKTVILSKRYNISRGTIDAIRKGRSWSALTRNII